jgi:hypothetical protein|tara:strand:- start:740 stop:1171 length:432 start_codon:yes stop_codon:yes gene_type:complete
MTDKEQENLIELIVDVARNSCNDGFNEHNANREAEIVVQNLVKKLNIEDVSKPFKSILDTLISRLEKASDIKYPNRPYTPEFRKSVALMWEGKESELLMQVKKLEKEVNVTLGNVSQSFTEKQMDDAYDKGYEDGATTENEMH